MNCQEDVNLKAIGYYNYSDKCSFRAKYEIEWETVSGRFRKKYCTRHYKKRIDFIKHSEFETLISSNAL